MRKSGYLIFFIAISFFQMTSCATLFQGTNEEIDINSDPPGANVTVNDGRSGLTPFSIKENRDSDVQVHFSKSGYEPYDVSDVSHVEWGYVVSDIFFTGLIGLGIDGADGAMFQHSDKMVSAHLEPIASVPVAAVPTLSPVIATSGAPAASAPLTSINPPTLQPKAESQPTSQSIPH